MANDASKIAAEYKALRPDYVVFGEILTVVLEQAARDRELKCIVQARAKDIASVIGKVLRKPKYKDSVALMTDLCGARVITECDTDSRPICEFIRKHFVIDEANSEDKLDVLGAERFGYLSVHFIVSFRPGVFAKQVETLTGGKPEGELCERFRAAAARIGALLPPTDGSLGTLDPTKYKAEIQVRTLLQHAWAAIRHDRLYKGEFEPPVQLVRQSNRTAAILEEADRLLNQTIRDVETYTNYFGGYLGPEEMRDRMSELQASLEYVESESRFRTARRIGRMAVWLRDWETVVGALETFAIAWRKSPAGRSLVEDVVQVLAKAPLDAYELEGALTRQAEFRDPDWAGCLIDYGKALWATGHREGREWLDWATHLDPQSADAWVELGDTYRSEHLSRPAREQYQQAVAVSPHDPRALQRLVLTSTAEKTPVNLLAGYLRGAIDVCSKRAAAHVYLPHAWYDIGFFHLVLGEPYEALESYAAGVLGSHTLEQITESLQQLTSVWYSVERGCALHLHLDWVLRFLTAAKVAKARLLLPAAARDHDKDVAEAANSSDAAVVERARARAERAAAFVAELKDAARPENLRRGPLNNLVAVEWSDKSRSLEGQSLVELPILMVAGGCEPRSEASIAACRDLVFTAFAGWRGAVFGGGTKSGVSRLAGDLPGAELLKLAYQPRHRSQGTEPYTKAYDYLVASGGELFSPREPLQCWVDLLAAGVDPAQVRLLGINGGRTSAIEYRVALALGAQVGLIANSGRAVAELLADPVWLAAPTLVPLPADPRTLWFFFHEVKRAKVLKDDDRDHLARAEHETYIAARARSLAPNDAALRLWGDLPDALKASALQKIDTLSLKLEVAGLQIVYVGATAMVNQPTPEQVKTIQEIEHGRWNYERLSTGWRLGPRDHQARTSPYLVPWTDHVLDSMSEYDWNDETVKHLAARGYEIRPREASPPAIELLPEEDCKLSEECIGPGALLCEIDKQRAAFPLQSLSMQARISGPLASVEVSQKFSNPYQEPIEAVYIFPLPAGAAVYRFRMTVGDRVVDGVVQERAQARQTYEDGIRQGHRSALLEQERDNVFTARVGNLPPGEAVTIEIAYAHRLEVNTAENQFRFPLVVGPRHIPGQPLDGVPVGDGMEPDTNVVPDASRLSPPVLVPGLQSGAVLSLTVSIETGGLMPTRLACSQHAITQGADNGCLTIELSRNNELLNRDFILKFRLADELPRAVLLAGEKHFLLTLQPPRSEQPVRTPRDVVFLLDRSGSMEGNKMESSKKALIQFLDTLEGQDRCAVLAFDDKVESSHDGSLQPLTELARTRTWIQTIQARGGTEIASPMNTALGMKTTEDRLLCIVLITDGQVGNEPQIYQMVQTSGSAARIFTLGVDTAVNDAFLRRLAQLGRGTCELVTPGEALETALNRLARETGHPLLTSIDLTDQGLSFDPASLVPEKIPDLFAERPVVVMGKKSGSGAVKLVGRMGGKTDPWNVTIQPTLSGNPAIGIVWARERVTSLEDRLRLETGLNPADIEKQILDLALEYQLLTRFTAFVLVDRSEVVNATGQQRTVVQPVETPAEWDMLNQAPAGFQVPRPAPMMASPPAPDWGAPPPPAAWGAPPPPPSMDFGAPPDALAGGPVDMSVPEEIFSVEAPPPSLGGLFGSLEPSLSAGAGPGDDEEAAGKPGAPLVKKSTKGKGGADPSMSTMAGGGAPSLDVQLKALERILDDGNLAQIQVVFKAVIESLEKLLTSFPELADLLKAGHEILLALEGGESDALDRLKTWAKEAGEKTRPPF